MKRHMLLPVGMALLLGIGAAQAAGDAQAGKAKAAACAGCHGADGQGVAPNPALAGMNAEKFVEAMKDYKSGKRNNAIMKSIATPLTDQDLDNINDEGMPGMGPAPRPGLPADET
jgi:cytochrome c553